MKRFLFSTTILAIAAMGLSSVSMVAYSQDAPKAQKTERHIKMVKVDDTGKTTELDTVLTHGGVFVWNGDTIGGKNEMKWFSKDDLKLDSIHKNFDMNFEYEIKDDGKGKMMILKSGKDGEKKMMRWHGTDGENVFIHAPAAPGMPHPPAAPHALFLGNTKRGNVIDLSDPGIISFDKKVRKDGTEKITIVRKQKTEEEIMMNEKIIIGEPGAPAIWNMKNQGEAKQIRIVTEKDGKVEVIEKAMDGKAVEKSENVRVIKEGDKIIHIKEINENGEKKVEVKVEKEEGKK